MISSPIEDLFYKLLLVNMTSITILWESELITLLPARTSLAQYCPIDPKVTAKKGMFPYHDLFRIRQKNVMFTVDIMLSRKYDE